MDKLSRRTMLRQSSALAGAAALFPMPGSGAQEERPDRKLRVVAVGGHCDDPQSSAGGTLTIRADQGHDVVALSLTGGPPPPPSANPADRAVQHRLDGAKMAEILKIRLECLNYSGSNSGQFTLPVIYGTASEITGERYKEFTEILLDKYKPDIVFTHWPIDFHMDHRAASLLTYSGWLSSGNKFPFYFFEVETGTQTQDFYPTHYVDITSVEERTQQAAKANALYYDANWPLHAMIRRFGGRSIVRKRRKPYDHPESPRIPALPA